MRAGGGVRWGGGGGGSEGWREVGLAGVGVGGQERVNEGLITATSHGVLDKVWQR